MQYLRVSIIINSYNYGRFLRQTIGSALQQTHPSVEVIVVDDGSTDNSKEIIREYDGKIVSVFKSNGGQGSAFNAGFYVSRGDVIIFLDSDDVLLCRAAEEAAKAFQDERLSKVDWPLYIINENGIKTGEIIPRQGYPNEDIREITLKKGPFYDWNITAPTSGNAWSRRFLSSIFPMPEEKYETCADEYLLTLSPVYGNTKRLKHPYACYRSHGSNNGWGRRLSNEKVESDMRRFELSSATLARHLQQMGIYVDPATWQEQNWNYKWMKLLQKAKQELLSIIPPSEPFVLIDDYELGEQIIPDRNIVSFQERGGKFSDYLSDQESAIEQVTWLKDNNFYYLVFWWTSFYWLNELPQLKAYLNTNCLRIFESDGIIVYHLKYSFS